MIPLEKLLRQTTKSLSLMVLITPMGTQAQVCTDLPAATSKNQAIFSAYSGTKTGADVKDFLTAGVSYADQSLSMSATAASGGAPLAYARTQLSQNGVNFEDQAGVSASAEYTYYFSVNRPIRSRTSIDVSYSFSWTGERLSPNWAGPVNGYQRWAIFQASDMNSPIASSDRSFCNQYVPCDSQTQSLSTKVDITTNTTYAMRVFSGIGMYLWDAQFHTGAGEAKVGISLTQGDAASRIHFSPGLRAVTRARDFDGDGNADLLFQNTAGQIVAWYLNGTGGIKRSASFYPGSLAPWRIVGTADFNNDGKTDLLFQYPGGPLVIWYLDGAGGVSGSSNLYTGSLNDWKVVATADLNKDGNVDILFQNESGQVYVWYLNCAGVVGESGFFSSTPTGPWRIAGVADMNSDGHPDILFQHPQGQLYAWYTNGAGAISNTGFLYEGALADFRLVSTSDMNNDGHADLLFQNDAGLLHVWYYNGAGAIASSNTFYGGALQDWKVVSR